MMKAEDLKNSVLQMAMQGKLVPQDPNDESASMLLEKIKQEKEQLIKDKKIKRNNKESTIWKENGHWYEKIGKNGDITCIDTEIPFKIPESWCWTKLNVMGFIQTGNTPPTKNPENYGDYIPFIKPGDIYYNKINYENEFLSKIGESRGRIIKKNSVMMVCIGGSRGKCYYNKRDVCCNQQINTITPYLIDYKFVFYYFCTKYFQNKMINDATGTATPLVNKTSWGNFFIPIPSLKEQKRIVEKLEQILPQIEQYAKYEEKLTKLNNEFPDKLKKSILQQAIQGKLVPQNPEDEPATILLEKIKQEKEQLIKEGKIKRNKNESTIYKKDGHWYEVIDKFNEVKCIDEEIPFDIPKSWCWTKMSNIIELISGRDLKKDEYDDNNIGIPYITGASNIQNNQLIINRWIKKPVVISTKNDLLLTCKGTVGKTIILQEDKVHIARQIMALHPFSETIDINYINIFIKFHVNKLQMLAKSMIPGISREDVLKLYIPLPPEKEQNEINKQINKIFELINI